MASRRPSKAVYLEVSCFNIRSSSIKKLWSVGTLDVMWAPRLTWCIRLPDKKIKTTLYVTAVDEFLITK